MRVQRIVVDKQDLVLIKDVPRDLRKPLMAAGAAWDDKQIAFVVKGKSVPTAVQAVIDSENDFSIPSPVQPKLTPTLEALSHLTLVKPTPEEIRARDQKLIDDATQGLSIGTPMRVIARAQVYVINDQHEVMPRKPGKLELERGQHVEYQRPLLSNDVVYALVKHGDTERIVKMSTLEVIIEPPRKEVEKSVTAPAAKPTGKLVLPEALNGVLHFTTDLQQAVFRALYEGTPLPSRSGPSLKVLVDHGLVEKREDTYRITDLGLLTIEDEQLYFQRKDDFAVGDRVELWSWRTNQTRWELRRSPATVKRITAQMITVEWDDPTERAGKSRMPSSLKKLPAAAPVVEEAPHEEQPITVGAIVGFRHGPTDTHSYYEVVSLDVEHEPTGDSIPVYAVHQLENGHWSRYPKALVPSRVWLKSMIVIDANPVMEGPVERSQPIPSKVEVTDEELIKALHTLATAPSATDEGWVMQKDLRGIREHWLKAADDRGFAQLRRWPDRQWRIAPQGTAFLQAHSPTGEPPTTLLAAITPTAFRAALELFSQGIQANLHERTGHADQVAVAVRTDDLPDLLPSDLTIRVRIQFHDAVDGQFGEQPMNVTPADLVDVSKLNTLAQFVAEKYHAYWIGKQKPTPLACAICGQPAERTSADGHPICETHYQRAQEYAARRDRRVSGLKRAADRAHKESEGAFKSARELMQMVPMGQPILIGHHSEKMHRAHLKRVDGKMRKALDASEREKELNYRAHAAERNAAISSDDPEAVLKLQAKIDEAIALQKRMKDENALVRQAMKKPEADRLAWLVSQGVAEGDAAAFLKPDYMKRVYAHAPYTLTNLNANIRRMQERLEDLKRRAAKAAASGTTKTEYAWGTVTRDVDDNRLRIEFHTRQSPDVTKVLKQRGFKWAPSVGAWQRMITGNAEYDAKCIVELMEKRQAEKHALSTPEPEEVITADPEVQALDEVFDDVAPQAVTTDVIAYAHPASAFQPSEFTSEIRVTTADGPRLVKAQLFGTQIALHRTISGPSFTLTHVSSGMAFADVSNAPFMHNIFEAQAFAALIQHLDFDGYVAAGAPKDHPVLIEFKHLRDTHQAAMAGQSTPAPAAPTAPPSPFAPAPTASPVRQQYLRIKNEYPGTVVAFQLGDFYEFFDDDATIAAQVCDLVMTSRPVTKTERTPMAGFPVHALDRYLPLLLAAGHHVAVVNQMTEPSGAGVVERKVVGEYAPSKPAAVEQWWIDLDDKIFRDDEPSGTHHAILSGPFGSEAEAQAYVDEQRRPLTDMHGEIVESGMSVYLRPGTTSMLIKSLERKHGSWELRGFMLPISAYSIPATAMVTAKAIEIIGAPEDAYARDTEWGSESLSLRQYPSLEVAQRVHAPADLRYYEWEDRPFHPAPMNISVDRVEAAATALTDALLGDRPQPEPPTPESDEMDKRAEMWRIARERNWGVSYDMTAKKAVLNPSIPYTLPQPRHPEGYTVTHFITTATGDRVKATFRRNGVTSSTGGSWSQRIEHEGYINVWTLISDVHLLCLLDHDGHPDGDIYPQPAVLEAPVPDDSSEPNVIDPPKVSPLVEDSTPPSALETAAYQNPQPPYKPGDVVRHTILRGFPAQEEVWEYRREMGSVKKAGRWSFRPIGELEWKDVLQHDIRKLLDAGIAPRTGSEQAPQSKAARTSTLSKTQASWWECIQRFVTTGDAQWFKRVPEGITAIRFGNSKLETLQGLEAAGLIRIVDPARRIFEVMETPVETDAPTARPFDQMVKLHCYRSTADQSVVVDSTPCAVVGQVAVHEYVGGKMKQGDQIVPIYAVSHIKSGMLICKCGPLKDSAFDLAERLQSIDFDAWWDSGAPGRYSAFAPAFEVLGAWAQDWHREIANFRIDIQAVAKARKASA